MGQHGVVEIDAAEPLEALGRAEELGPVVAVAHDGGVERAATEVEHRHRLAVLETAEVGVVAGGRLWLRHQLDVLDAGEAG